jgi:hypothetical protein
MAGQSGWGLNLGKLWSGKRVAGLGLIKAPRNSYGYETHWYCEECWSKQPKEDGIVSIISRVVVVIVIFFLFLWFLAS